MSEIINFNNRYGSVLTKLEDVEFHRRSNSPPPVQEGGWDFWNRVYTNPELRQMMEDKAQVETPISELLQSNNLCRAEVNVLNVPRLSDTQHVLVRTIIQKELRANVPILDVEITPKKWIVRFYRQEDAIRVRNAMDGFHFRGRSLKTSMVELMAQPSSVPVTEPPKEESNPNWGTAEWTDILSFKNELISLLSQAPNGLTIEEALGDLKQMRRRGVVPSILESWPTAIIRLFAPQVRLTGRYVSLSEQSNLPALIRKSASEGTPRVPLESWETMAPGDIRTDLHLSEYFVALLTTFGPQHISIDLPIRLLASCLGRQWGNTTNEIVSKVVGISPQFIVLNDVLYLATNVRHRRMLLDYIQPTNAVPRTKGNRHFHRN